MKKIRNFIVCLLVVAMTVSLSACSKKPLSEKKFREIMEDKYDYEITENSLIVGEELVLIANRDSFSIHALYALYEDEDTAIENMERKIEITEEAQEEGEFDGTIKKSGSGDFEKVVIEGERSRYDLYEVWVRCDKLIIRVSKDNPDKEDVKKVNKIIKDFGY